MLKQFFVYRHKTFINGREENLASSSRGRRISNIDIVGVNKQNVRYLRSQWCPPSYYSNKGIRYRCETPISHIKKSDKVRLIYRIYNYVKNIYNSIADIDNQLLLIIMLYVCIYMFSIRYY